MAVHQWLVATTVLPSHHFRDLLFQLYAFLIWSAMSTPPMWALYFCTASEQATVIRVPSFFFRLTLVLLDGLQRVLMTGIGPSCPSMRDTELLDKQLLNDVLPSSVALLLSVVRASPFGQFAWWQHTRCFCLTSTMPRVQ